MADERRNRRTMYVPSTGGSRGAATERAWPVRLDLAEKGDQLFVFVELPGVALTDVSVSIRSNVLVVGGTKQRSEAVGDKVHYFCMERGSGRFRREVALPFLADVASASAVLSGGVLRITLNRMEERRGRTYEIPVSSE